jgi:hypothetical protein
MSDNFQILPENSDSRGTYRDDSDVYGLSQLSYLQSGDEANDESTLLRTSTISSVSSFVPQNNTLHRKPSFLGPESQYDGGGFQFLSGLSQ